MIDTPPIIQDIRAMIDGQAAIREEIKREGAAWRMEGPHVTMSYRGVTVKALPAMSVPAESMIEHLIEHLAARLYESGYRAGEQEGTAP